MILTPQQESKFSAALLKRFDLYEIVLRILFVNLGLKMMV